MSTNKRKSSQSVTQAEATVVIGGRRGYGVRWVVYSGDIFGEFRILAGSDFEGRMEKLSSPLTVADHTAEGRRGVDGLIIPLYLGHSIEVVENGLGLDIWKVKATFTRGGKPWRVFVPKDTPFNSEGVYAKRDVVSAFYVHRIKGRDVRRPWQCECDRVSKGRNAHEYGMLKLGW